MIRPYILVALTALISTQVFAYSVTHEGGFDFEDTLSTDLKNQIIGDMDFLRSMKGDKTSPIHQEIFGGVELDGSNYLNYLASRITEFGPDDLGDQTTLAYVSTIFPAHKMWITSNYSRYSMPQVARAAIVIHEARHAEEPGDHWPHVDCPTPFLDENGNLIRGILSGIDLSGLPGCDDSSRGAYAVEAVMLKNVEAHCHNCTNKVKMDAQLFGDDDLKRIIAPKAKAELRADLLPQNRPANFGLLEGQVSNENRSRIRPDPSVFGVDLR